MTGLEKIIQQIQSESSARVEELLQDARQEAAQIELQGRAEGEKRAAKIAEDSRREVAQLHERAVSAAALRQKARLLQAKQQLVTEILEEARLSLVNAPEEEYFSLLADLIEKNAQPGESGVLYLNTRDRERVPPAFLKDLKARLAGSGAALALADGTRPIDGGFVLVYGCIEENCSFSALFSAARDRLQDAVCGVLFE